MKFFIAGVKFHSMPSIIGDVEVGDVLTLEPEPENRFDPNAVGIVRVGKKEDDPDTFCGYVPKKFSAEVSMLIDINPDVRCVTTIVNPSAKTWEMCEVEIIGADSQTDPVSENTTDGEPDDND